MKKLKLKSRIFLGCSIGFIIFIGLGVGLLYIPWWGSHLFSPHQYLLRGLPVDDFTYLLQYESFSSRNSALTTLRDLPHDLLILEGFYDEEWWTVGELNEIGRRSEFLSSQKRILCYLSIGEAENYREYWDPSWDADQDGIPDTEAPSWLDRGNPEWEGNYKVRYWESEWQDLIFGDNSSYLDQVIAHGFDGVYLDLIDAYEFYEEQGDLDAGINMVNFVANLSSYAKSKQPEFLIFAQNGEQLVQNSIFLEAIDGIGREDIVCNGNWLHTTAIIEEVDLSLTIAQENSKCILEIEYPTIPYLLHRVYSHAEAHEYLCYVGPRDLDFIAIQTAYYLPT